MSNTKITYYNIDPLDSKGCDINLLWGERSNGKSYQVKHKKGINKFIESAIENRKRFVYLRRFVKETSTEKVERYFADIDVARITNNKYNCITVYRKELFLSFFDINTGKTSRGEKIGYVMVLALEQDYAGSSYLDVEDLIFEEFMSRSEYLHDEPDKLMNLYSTIDRKRHKLRMWLVGNTISKVCPYINDWGLLDIVNNQKQGTIATTKIDTGSVDENGKKLFVTIAIEHCANTGTSSFAIGKHKDMLNKGEWQSDPQPHLPKSYKKYKVMFRFIFYFKGFKYISELLQDIEDLNTCWYIKPYKGKINNNTIVFSDIISTSPFWHRYIYDTNFPNRKINEVLSTFRESKIFYASDICGTEFKQAIDFAIKK